MLGCMGAKRCDRDGQQVAWSAAKPGVEDVLLELEARTAAYSGQLGKPVNFPAGR
jgi:hypothetical protein